MTDLERIKQIDAVYLGRPLYFHRPHPDKAALRYRVEDVRKF